MSDVWMCFKYEKPDPSIVVEWYLVYNPGFKTRGRLKDMPGQFTNVETVFWRYLERSYPERRIKP